MRHWAFFALFPLGNGASADAHHDSKNWLNHPRPLTDVADFGGIEGSLLWQTKLVHHPHRNGVHGTYGMEVLRHVMGHIENVAHFPHSNSEIVPFAFNPTI